MYKYVLRSMEGVDIFPVIALVIFFAFFVGLLTWVLRKDKSYVDHMSNMPLHDDTAAPSPSNNNV